MVYSCITIKKLKSVQNPQIKKCSHINYFYLVLIIFELINLVKGELDTLYPGFY